MTETLGKKILTLLLFSLFFVPFSSFAGEEKSADSLDQKGQEQQEIKEYILHHNQDSYDFNIWHEMGIGFPLPIILVDEGLHVFLSSKFHHGEEVAESNGKYYAIYHNKIYRTDADGTMNFDEAHHPTNIKPLDLSITKNVFSIILFSLLIFFIFKSFAKSYEKSLIPNKTGRLLEPLVIFVRDEIAIPNIGEKHYKKYMSYLLTVFFFIWFLNLAGMTPLGINVTGNIAITFCLALLTFLITTFSAKKSYWAHIFWMPGVPIPMRIILAPIEVIGAIIKPFALMVRLYANISAGHIVLMSLISLLYIFKNVIAGGAFLGLALLISVLELLVAFLQAYIFTILTALYFGDAAAEHEDH